MQREEWSEFGGVAGRLVAGSISGGSLISGVVLGLGLLIVDWMLTMAGASGMVVPFNLIVLGFVLSRFAVNGLYGEWSGTVFSGAGGPWTVVGTVALRYLALTFIWYMPLTLIGMKVVEAPEGAPLSALPMMMGGSLVFAAINLLAVIVTPPLFLIVSVSATSIGDVFSADHWRRLFSGRKEDLFTVYVVYSGALFMVAMLAVPLAMLAMAVTDKLAILIGAASFCLLFGVSVNLLGRLCGFFACGDLGRMDRQPVFDPAPQPGSSGPLAAETPRRPLEDAKARVDAAVQGFDRDPDAALAALQRMNAEFAPHPLVLQTLALCNYRSGRVEPAIHVAREAIPLCFERGHSSLAAQLFREMRQHRSHLALTLEQLLTIGHTLIKMQDYATAAKAYTAVIGQDRDEARAIKGLLQVAEKILRDKHMPEAAIKVYRYLLQHCSSTPLAEYIHAGLEEAERTIAQPTTP